MDKFQILSKINNYRTRASFKLIQIDKKINFLRFSHAMIDLCCAPGYNLLIIGGWLQICKKKSHTNALILGIDIVKISFLQGIYFFKKNIIYNKTIELIKHNFSSIFFETILHDGSPNIGTDKNLDYYNQNKLSFISLKYCVLLLSSFGIFVTKFFFSKDIYKYLFIIKKIFFSIIIYKPTTSRYSSSEIYIICLALRDLKINRDFFKKIFQRENKFFLLSNHIKKISKKYQKNIILKYNFKNSQLCNLITHISKCLKRKDFKNLKLLIFQ
uniref:SAM-dependent methyltransferase n=1 Tax=Lotharella vacuolata TaxID=74820 RepID=A0A0H5BHG0_9EUKA|nr:SAM-dependent methyltransferase [Lotharella vacuolata]